MSSVEDLRMVMEQLLQDGKIDADAAGELRNIVMEDRVLSAEERQFLEDSLAEGKFTDDAAQIIRQLLETTPTAG